MKLWEWGCGVLVPGGAWKWGLGVIWGQEGIILGRGGVLQAFERRNWGVLGQGWGIWGSRRENEGKSGVFWGSWGVLRGREGACGGEGSGGQEWDI